jgi:hypothetical protein
VSEQGYGALARILQNRPFDSIPGLNYRYFFVPSVAKIDDHIANVAIRIEQDKYGKNFDFAVPRDVAANLLWFFELKDWKEAKHLYYASHQLP